MLFGKDTAFSEWAATFPARGATCTDGNDWSAKQSGKTIEQALFGAGDDRSFRPAWAAWAIEEYYGEIDTRVKGLLFTLIRRRPVIAALFLKKNWRKLSDVDRLRCLKAFHPDHAPIGMALEGWHDDVVIKSIIRKGVKHG